MTKLRRENADLLGLRKKVDGEIDELTAALFEEAYKMVNGAHERRAKVEKKLEESQGVVSLCPSKETVVCRNDQMN